MQQEAINLDELKLSDRLAVARTVMGADRTLMASVRTSLSLISFGFTIFKILEQIQKAGVAKLVREQTPRNIGIFMILVGILPLALSMFQYQRMVSRLGGKNVYVNPNMVSAAAILLLGISLLIVVVWNLNVI
jgi:putative membrane protein